MPISPSCIAARSATTRSQSPASTRSRRPITGSSPRRSWISSTRPPRYRVTGTTDRRRRGRCGTIGIMPFCRRMDMTYPSGIRHIIINCATPIDDGRIQLVQLLYRNDTEDQCPTQALIDWDAAVVYEDRDILEATDPDAALGPGASNRGAHDLRPARTDHAAPAAGVVEEQQRPGGDAELCRCGGVGPHFPRVEQTVRIGMTLEAKLIGVDLLVTDAVLQREDMRVGDRNARARCSAMIAFSRSSVVKRTIGRPLAVTCPPTRRNSRCGISSSRKHSCMPRRRCPAARRRDAGPAGR